MNLYVAYNRKDIEIVRPIVLTLQKRGVDIWFEECEIESGDNFAEKLTTNIKRADCVLFFHSANTRDSQWSQREISYAQALNKKIVCVKIDKSELGSWVEFNLATSEYIQIETEYSEKGIQNILNLIKFNKTTIESAPSNSKNQTATDNNPNMSPDTLWERKIKKGTKCGCIVFVIFTIFVLLLTFYWVGDSNPNPTFSSDNYDVAADSYWVDTIAAYSVACDTVTESVDSELDIEHNTAENTQTEVADTTFVDTIQSNNSLKSHIRTYQHIQDHIDRCIILTIIATFVISTLFWFLISKIFKKKKQYDVKLGSNFSSQLKIDGEMVRDLPAYTMHTKKMKAGHYLVDFQPLDNKEKHLTYNLAVNKNAENYIFAEISNGNNHSLNSQNIIKIFIAGSLKLGRERDALRSVISIMYNKWQFHDFKILSYTFEDFSNKFKADGGQQTSYDEFIENEADWAVFVLDGHVGGITRSEFNKALAAHKKTGKPNILALQKRF